MAREILGQGVYQFSFKGDPSGVQAFSNAVASIGKGGLPGITNLNQGIQRFNINAGAGAASSQHLGKSLNNLSKELFYTSMALGAVSSGLMLVGKSVMGTAFNFDRGMTLVKAVLGATTDEMEALSKVAIDVGTASEFGAAKASQALLTLARMGLDAAESMEVLAPAVALAQSQQYDLTKTSDLLIQQMKSYGAATSEAAKYSNIMAASASATALDMDKLVNSLGYVSPIAAMSGRSFEEVNVALGLMSNAGIEASRSGTSLRAVFASLLSPTPKARAAIEKLGLSLKDVDPSTNKLSLVFGRFAEKLNGVSNSAKYMFDIFGRWGSSGVSAIVNAINVNGTAFTDLENKITGTDEAFKQAKAQLNSFSGQLLLVKSSLESAGIALGQDLAPMVSMLADGLKGLTEWFRNASPAVKNFTGTMLSGTTITVGLGLGLTTLAWMLTRVGQGLKQLSGFMAVGVNSMKQFGNVVVVAAKLKQFNAALSQASVSIMTNASLLRVMTASNAEYIGLEALAAAATKTTTAAQWEAYKAYLASALARAGLTEATIAATVAEAEATMVNLGMAKAMKIAVVNTTFLGAAMVGLKNVTRGLLAALGGWPGVLLTVATIAIPMLLTAMGRLKAKKEELAKQQKMDNEQANELGSSLKELEREYDNLAEQKQKEMDAGKKSDVLDKAMLGNKELQRSTLVKLITLYPEILKNYDAENDKLEIHNELLKEKMKLGGSYTVQDELNLGALKTPEQKQQYMDWRIPAQQKMVEDLTMSIQASENKVVKWKKQLKEATEFSGSYNEMQVKSAQASVAKDNIKKEGENYEYLNKQMTNALNTLESLMKLQKSLKSGQGLVDEEDLDAKNAKLAEQAAAYDALLAKLKDMKRRAIEAGLAMQKMLEDISFESAAIGMTEFEKSLQNVDKKISDLTDSAGKSVRDYQEAIFDLQDSKKGQKLSSSQEAELNEQLEGLKQAEFAIEEAAAALGQKLRDDIFKKYILSIKRSIEDLKMENRSLAVDVAAMWGETAESMAEKTSIEVDTMVTGIQRKIEDLKTLQSNLKDEETPETIVLREQYNKEMDEYLKEYGIILKKKFNLEKKSALEILKMKQDVEKRQFDLNSKFQLAIAANDVKLAKQRLALVKEGTPAQKEALMDVQEAQQKFNDTLVSGLKQGGIAAIDFVSVLDSSMSDFEKGTLTNVFNMMMEMSMSKPNWGSVATGAVSIITGIVQSIKAQREEEKTRAEELAQSQYDLKMSTYELRDAFVTSARDILGMGTSAEDIAQQKTQSISNIAGSIGSVKGVGDVAKDIVIPLIDYIKTIPGLSDRFQTGGEDMQKVVSLLQATAGSADFAIGQGRASAADYTNLENLKELGALPAEVAAAFDGIKAGTTSTLEVLRMFRDSFQGSYMNITNAGTSVSDDTVSELAKYFQVEFAAQLREGFITGVNELITSGASNDEIIKKLEEIKQGYLEIGNETVDAIVDGKTVQRPLVDVDEAIAVARKLFETKLGEAKKGGPNGTGDPVKIVAAYEGFASDITDITKTFGIAVGSMQGIDLALELNQNAIEMQSDITEANTEATNDLNDTLKGTFSDSISKIEKAFKSGMSLTDTLSLIEKLRYQISKLPVDLQKDLYDQVNSLQLSVYEDVMKNRESVAGTSASSEDAKKKYIADLDKVDEKFKELQAGWNDLLGERTKVITDMDKEAQKVQDDSKKRVQALEGERDALLGNFDFSETQSVRSKRFDEVRKKELAIRDEMMKTSADLQSIEDKRMESLEKIQVKMDEMEAKNGEQHSWEIARIAERTDAELAYQAALQDELQLMIEMGLLSQAEVDRLKNASEMYDVIAMKRAQYLAQTGSVPASQASLSAGVAASQSASAGIIPSAPAMNPTSAPTVSTGSRSTTSGTAQHVPVPSGLGKSVTPISDLAAQSNTVNPPVTYVMNIYETVDLRGAYGITSPEVAQGVWDKVWAPARRRSVSRILETRGSVLR
jgi:TP901 family phage tail tape measure protein